MKRPKIKICGITRCEEAIAICELGVDILGFILYPPSPRYISPDKIKDIIKEIPPLVKTVGVFVNTTKSDLLKIVNESGIDTVQLSGDESPEYCQSLSNTGLHWIKSFRIKDKLELNYLNQFRSKYFLLDAWSEKEYGGTGKSFNWEIATKASQKYQIILAGGIDAKNVGKAVEQIKPYGIDVSSGVELSPGRKSIPAIKDLLNEVEKTVTGAGFPNQI